MNRFQAILKHWEYQEVDISNQVDVSLYDQVVMACELCEKTIHLVMFESNM